LNCIVARFDVGLLSILNRKVIIFLLAGILIGLVGSQWYSSVFKETGPVLTKDSVIVEKANESETTNSVGTEIPSYVIEVRKYVRAFHEPKEGYVGGRKFMNFEGKLPKRTAGNVKINYKEWDVHPKIKGQNRGAERLVTGDDNSDWYTKDHYKSFIKVP